MVVTPMPVWRHQCRIGQVVTNGVSLLQTIQHF
jgi:hypothetical protein